MTLEWRRTDSKVNEKHSLYREGRLVGRVWRWQPRFSVNPQEYIVELASRHPVTVAHTYTLIGQVPNLEDAKLMLACYVAEQQEQQA